MLYDPKQIEARWRATWEEKGLHRATREPGRPKYFCLDMFPYPSGEGLHVGHWRGYVLSDVWSRYMTLQGFRVLHPMGWDAFGLPAENAAIKKKIHPEPHTRAAMANMKRQLGEMGAMYDWSREVNSSAPEYYKWTQWTFLKLYEMGLAYKKGAPINWCPSCRTGMADEEVKDGLCERCDSVVTKKDLPQWFYAITKYSQRLIDDLEGLDWPEKVKKMQADWIGRSEGAEVCFSVEGRDDKLWIFTTRPDTLFGATYMVLAPEHPLVDALTSPEQKAAVEEYVTRTRTRSEVERQEQKEKTGVFTGGYALNPVNGERIPIWIADYVLMGYGTGAIMAVPAHDTRDWEFARAFNLPIRQVILAPEAACELSGGKLPDPLPPQALDRAYQERFPDLPLSEAAIEPGIMVNSMDFSGLSSEAGKTKVVQRLEAQGLGRARINYRLRDWLVSRQRYWGAPIPIVYCDACGTVPVPEDQLPVFLPHVESYEPSGTGASPLANLDEFVQTKCPRCGGPGRRDTDTLSQWICSSWYFLRYASPDATDVPWRREDVDEWLPVDMYVGGIEHAVLHLLYSRFYTKVFFDLGLVDFNEPFKRLFNQGMITRVGTTGRLEKMSKSKGNSVNPDDLVERYGTDALRAYLLFIGPPELDAEWNDSGIEGVYRWIRRVWNFVIPGPFAEGPETNEEILRLNHRYLKKITEDMERLHLNTVVAALMEWLNALGTWRQKEETPIALETVRTYLLAMAPVAPHVVEELWNHLGGQSSVFEGQMTWPKWEPQYLVEDQIDLIVQVHGKVRDRIRVAAGATQAEVEREVMALEKVTSALAGRAPKRVIYVPGKLVNVVPG
jgi:leucyl-tRNA synthetase